VELVDQLLEHHIYSEIAGILDARGLRPGGSARPGRGDERFTAKRVAYLMHTYRLRSRYDRLRGRGMLNRKKWQSASIFTNRQSSGGQSMESSKPTTTTITDGNFTRFRGRTCRLNIAVDGIDWWIEQQACSKNSNRSPGAEGV